jgi:hypothetical protein
MAHKLVSKYKKEEKVTDDVFKELLAIIDLESDGKSTGWRLRRDRLDEWKEKWLCNVEAEVSVVKPELFQSEHKDLILDRLAHNLAQELTEETTFTTSGRKMKASINVIRRSPKK